MNVGGGKFRFFSGIREGGRERERERERVRERERQRERERERESVKDVANGCQTHFAGF